MVKFAAMEHMDFAVTIVVIVMLVLAVTQSVGNVSVPMERLGKNAAKVNTLKVYYFCHSHFLIVIVIVDVISRRHMVKFLATNLCGFDSRTWVVMKVEYDISSFLDLTLYAPIVISVKFLFVIPSHSQSEKS